MELGELRRQLGLMVEHMRATPDPRCGGEFWAEDLLSVTAPWCYDPEEVEGKHCMPVFVLWVRYLEDLQDAACNLEDEDMMWHYHGAIELAVGDLLAVSRQAARGYWKERIDEWERLNTL